MKYYFLLFTLMVFFCSGCTQESQTQSQADTKTAIRPVRYITLSSESVDQSRTFSGTAKASNESILSFKVAGTIKSIPVKVGDKVKKHTLLAELDKTDLTVGLESAKAGLKTSQADAKSAQTTVNTARSNYQRIQNLYENNNVSLSEFEQARGDYETAVAQLQAAKSRINTENAKLKSARNQLQYTRLNAPFEGIISEIPVDENEEVSSGEAILTLSGLGNLEVKINVSDIYISRMGKGMACHITFPALPGIEFQGRVAEVPYAAMDAPTYPVTIVIQTGDDRLRPGMAARVRFYFGDAASTGALYLPVDGVGEENGENFVFVITPDKNNGQKNQGTVQKRPVTIGELTENGFLVKSGLSSGDMVATSGLQLLMQGMAVKLLNDPVNEW
ncbi:RND family efflux transporter, MFP subunit [Desulfocicer vacuolatum DSM 3385]|uniref:RND family efflux transporter, MFP subunit n=1 Tax=Desulfocicer vacuolatum DSM 3385 TaxID=1121400 RepID=A0A1W2DYN4_9BACT|nr:efflux RND transporter periplasmic adaptor subunit [Desulfocicer vacuolatum]SMD02427.1 RND family efflux transporter, MFP subunit [Desulfocicer vacuolatum DSM 3385]